MRPDELPDRVREPLERWLAEAETAPIPASAREFAPSLYDELCRAVADESRELEELARDWRSATGTDRRGRALRILDRLSLLERALQAVSDARDRIGT